MMDGKHPVLWLANPAKFSVRGDIPIQRARMLRGRCGIFRLCGSQIIAGGVGKFAMNYLIEQAAAAGFHKLLSRIFVENASLKR